MNCPDCAASLPAQGARFCPSCGTRLTDSGPDERKVVTVLFADITGSTALGERFDPERWRALLRRFFSVMAASIEGWGGTVQKFAGDAVMAAFGIPILREDDAERALRAAWEMLDRLKELNREFESKHGVSLAIRIGINTGEVVSEPNQLIAIGDAVNVAARLEQLADPGTIAVGERTYQASRAAFAFDEPVPRELKGKASSVVVRTVLGPLETRPEVRSPFQVPMIGREAEVERLAGLFHQAMETASPRMALIIGQAGVGKSRLVREFLNLTAARHPERVLLQGRCPSAGKNLTYWALAELLRRECGITLDDSAATASERLRQRVQDVLGRAGLAGVDIDRTLNALAITAGIGLPGNPLEEVRPSAVDLEQAIAWPRLISAYTAVSPVILLIEDLHWADERMLTMLERVIARSTGPLLIVATARPEFRDANAGFAVGREDTDFLILQPLGDLQSEALLMELFQRAPIDEALHDELVSTAQGNPFFLEEIVRRLVESGSLERRNDRWVSRSNASKMALPDSVLAVLAARIDSLPLPEKRALQEASVIGRVFWEGPLQRATNDPDLITTLLSLEKKGLVTVRPVSTMAGDLEFSFKHALVRDVAYASLPLLRRAKAHGEVAEWIEETAGDRRDELSDLIAHHYRSAIEGEGAELAWQDDQPRHSELYRKAFEAILGSGVRARKRFATALALEQHQRALELVATSPPSGEALKPRTRRPAPVDRSKRPLSVSPKHERGVNRFPVLNVIDRVRALESIGDDHEAAFHGDDAVAAWEAAIALTENLFGEEQARVRLLVKCAKMTCIRWGGFKVVPPTRRVDAYINQALAASPAEIDRGWLLAMRAFLYTRKGEAAEIDAISREVRLEAGEEAVEIGRKHADIALSVLATRALSGLSAAIGDYPRAMELARTEYALNQRIPVARDRALAIVYFVIRLMDIEGGYKEGLEAAREAYRLGKELTIHEVQHATYLLIYGNAVLGRWTRVDEALSEHLDCWRREQDISCPFARAGPLIGAWALAHQGKVTEARTIVDEIPLEWNAPGVPEAWHGLALLECGDAQQARRTGERILEQRQRVTYEEGPFEYLLMVRTLLALKDWDALERFLPAATRMTGGLALLAPTCDQAAGLLALAKNDASRGRMLLEQAMRRYDELGSAADVARSREHLNQVPTH